jgi:hypothetical protein
VTLNGQCNLRRHPFLCGSQRPPSADSLRNTVVHMDALTAFGLFAVTAMLVFYALEERGPWYVLAFAGACALASAYGFLQGAWPFGIVEAIWALVAARRWQVKTRSSAA